MLVNRPADFSCTLEHMSGANTATAGGAARESEPGTGRLVGYARVSGDGAEALRSRVGLLGDAGCARVYTDEAAGRVGSSKTRSTLTDPTTMTVGVDRMSMSLTRRGWSPTEDVPHFSFPPCAC